MGKGSNAYISEYKETLNRIYKENRHLSGMGYFLNTALKRFDAKNGHYMKPDVVALGTAVPEELVIAAGAYPYFITGGSSASIAWSDSLVPRDTDPVSRSIFGFINQPNGADLSDALFIIPLSNDSMKKIAFALKRDGRKVHTVDVCPVKNEYRAVKKWQDQMLSMMDAVASHTGYRISRDSIRYAADIVSNARMELKIFLHKSAGRTDIITDAARILVFNSYYYTDSIAEWIHKLRLLTKEVQAMAAHRAWKSYYPEIMLLGSPVVFPNLKVPFLTEDCHLDIAACIDSSVLKAYVTYGKYTLYGSCEHMIKNIAADWYRMDASAAFVFNRAMHDFVKSFLKKNRVDGVVYHVLKGQVEYDFELERFENLFGRQGIPMIRIETDYQYQDVEQLRIRMEAFSEMLERGRGKMMREAL